MYNFRKSVLLPSIILLYGVNLVSSVKIKSGKLSPANITSSQNPQDSQFRPKLITPSQQIVHLLTPEKHRKRSKSRSKGKKFETANAWNLEYPRVPQLVNLSDAFNNTSSTSVIETTTSGNAFFSDNNLADSTWIGIKSRSTTQSIPNLKKVQEQDQPEPRLPNHSSVSVNRIGLFLPGEEDDSRSEENENPHFKYRRDNDRDEDVGPAERIDVKMQKLEEMVASLSKNVEVMKQNTQVISKGFNILSTRFNKLSSDQEELSLKIDNKYVLMEESVLRMQKDVLKKLKELDTKGESELKHLKQTNKGLVDSQVMSGQEHKKWMDNMAHKLTTWKADGEKESKVLAEMIKALAEIQKKEKSKLDHVSKNFETEVKELKEKVANEVKVGSASLREVLEKKIATVAMGLEASKHVHKNESDFLKSELGLLSKYLDDKVKKLEESLLEQNMAHNMAHEHIASKLANVEERLESVATEESATTMKSRDDLEDDIIIGMSPRVNQIYLDRLEKLEKNVTKMGQSQMKLEQKLESMEDTDTSILSRIADLRNNQNQEILGISSHLNKTEDHCKKLERKIIEFIKRTESDKMMETGGMSMNQEDMKPQSLLRSQDFLTLTPSLTNYMDVNDARDRFGTMEENVAELWRGQKDCKAEVESVHNLVKEMQQKQEKPADPCCSKEIEDVKSATQMLTNLVHNSSVKYNQIEKKVEDFLKLKNSGRNRPLDSREIEQISGRVKATSITSALPEDINTLKDEMQNVQRTLQQVLRTNQNVTKAQEFFLLKLLEMDQEHKKDNISLNEEISLLKHHREDVAVEITRSEERLNKVVQQFEITDAEQAKIREELLNIKDRLNGLEENYVNLWKTNKRFVGELEQVVNSVDNINLVHGSELQTLATELGSSKEKLDNVTKTWRNVENRLSNIELLMDIAVSEPNTSELSKLKTRLSNSEKDISELWKSSEILSFQQQVLSEGFKLVESTHLNETTERAKVQEKEKDFLEMLNNLTRRVNSVEKFTNPAYETKSIIFDIPDWNQNSRTGALKDVFVEYEIGELFGSGYKSQWKTYLEVNEDGTQLNIYNVLMKADMQMFNELEVQLIDGDGRVFSTFGPEQHLYKHKNDKIGWKNLISLSTLEDPKNLLISRNKLRLRLKIRVYPRFEKEEAEENSSSSEKQLVHWEIKNLEKKLKDQKKQNVYFEDEQSFNDLNVTKEFAAGHTWSGFSLWKCSLLTKRINGMEYLGIDVELLQSDGGWKELQASYNVTLMDAHNRIAKEFAISPNDFVTVSARHSYFMLVKDMQEILKRGDVIVLKMNFDLQAKRKAFDVEVIQSAGNSLL